MANSAFGFSVGTNDNSVIIGAPHNVIGSAGCSAYLFDITTGQERFKLTASDAAPDEGFGVSVGISGNLAIVGAFDDGTISNVVAGSGAGYVFNVNCKKSDARDAFIAPLRLEARDNRLVSPGDDRTQLPWTFGYLLPVHIP